MTLAKQIRWGGMALVLGATLWGLQKMGWWAFIGNADPLSYPQPTAIVLWAMGLVAALLILLGLPALHARQASQAGTMGAIAFIVVFAGMALVSANAYFGVFLQAGLVDLIAQAEAAGVTVQEPAAAAAGFMLSFGLYMLGWLLFGLSALRAKVLPRGALVLVLLGLLVGLLVMGIGASLPLPVTELGIALLGWALWQERGEPLARMRPVRSPSETSATS